MNERSATLGTDARDAVCAAVRGMVTQALTDWGAMLGTGGVIKSANLRLLPYSHDLVRRMVSGGVFVHTVAEGRISGPMAMVLPGALIGELLAVALMVPRSGSEPPAIDWENSGHVDGIRELVNLMCGSATRALGDLGVKVRVSQAVEHLSVHQHYEGAACVQGAARVACVRVDVEFESTTSAVWCVFPEAVAAGIALGT